LLWGSKLGWFPWETPAGNGLLGGRPQLTAGIRAGSYILSVPTSAKQRQSRRAALWDGGMRNPGPKQWAAHTLQVKGVKRVNEMKEVKE
jgi:hypothetical protein